MISRHLHWVLILGGVSVLGAAIGLIPDDAGATRAPQLDASQALDDGQIVDQAIAIPSEPTDSIRVTSPVVPEVELPGTWHEAEVKSGDNLSLIFGRHGLGAREVYRASSNKQAAKHLKKLFPGDTLRLKVDDGRLTELVYPFEFNRSLHMMRNDDGFEVALEEKPLERRVTHATAVISDSLFLSAQRAGMSDRLTMELAGIFGWDIDFALDIRAGDSFSVMYEEIYMDGEKIKDGDIIAADFTNQGRAFQAIRFTDDKGNNDYYSPDGKSLRKAFLRTPVAFSRISSRFNLKRKHPVLNKIRAHRGVDYAASTGTPIKATGDGKIVHRGRKGGYGKTIVIQHGSKYSTLYAHMSNYRRGFRVGSRVKQGQVIGYVGSSGLATGPHLHYEFRVSGVHRNPLTVKLPSAEPLPKKHRRAFKQISEQMLAQLDLIKRTQLALAE